VSTLQIRLPTRANYLPCSLIAGDGKNAAWLLIGYCYGVSTSCWISKSAIEPATLAQVEIDERPLRLLRYNLTALRYIDWRSVHARRFACRLGCAAKRLPYPGRKTLWPFNTSCSFHIFLSVDVDP